MKHILVAALACATSVTWAYAADLPGRATFPPVFVPAPIFTWTGFYVGVNAGGTLDSGSSSFINGNSPALNLAVADGTRPFATTTRGSAFTGGGQIGYNYQFAHSAIGGGPGGVVVGVEADAAYTDTFERSLYVSDRASAFASSTDFVGTVRGRVGYSSGNLLFYGTAGFAYGGVRNTTNFYGPAGALLYQGAKNSIRTGYAYGGGFEVAVPTQSFLNVFHAGALTFKAEFLRYELGSNSLPVARTTNVNPGFTQLVRDDGNLVRAGLNYKFSTLVPAPVVARY